MDSILSFIIKLLAGLVDGFKQKNPVVFSVIALALGSLWYTVDQSLLATLPDGTFLIGEGIRDVLQTAKTILVALLALVGSHTRGLWAGSPPELDGGK